MLNGRHQESVTGRRRRQRQCIGLRAAGDEHHVARLCSHERSHLLPRQLDQPVRGTALAVDRGRVAVDVERSKRCGPRLFAQRRGCVPVKIDTVRHTL
jgi:hypothetical protein